MGAKSDKIPLARGSKPPRDSHGKRYGKVNENHKNEQMNYMPAPRRRSGLSAIPLPVRIAAAALIIIAFSVIFFFVGKKIGTVVQNKIEQVIVSATDTDPKWTRTFTDGEATEGKAPSYVNYVPLVLNEYSRPGTYLSEVNGIVVHYVANPGTTAEQNRNYFNNLATTHETWASSHFIIGLDGEVLQLIPLDEWAYCSNDRNSDTLSIECCHPEEDGKFTDETYSSLVQLTADLCRNFGLDPLKDVIRHYDVTGKLCPLYFVEHEDEWHEFLTDVAAAMTADE